MTTSLVEESMGLAGAHIQLFVYRIPEKNHGEMLKLQKQLTDIYRKHGTLRSEFFQLNNPEAFMGFTNIASAVSASPGEEVWVEVDYYKDRGHRDEIVASVGEDGNAGPLFGLLMGLVAPGSNILMGDLGRLKV